MALISTGLALAGLGANLATGLANTATNIWSQKDSQAFNSEEALKAREFNSAEAQKQRDWEEQMSNTAYQRARADMEAAGLNPASIGMTGSASTPSGSAASASPASGSSSRIGSLPDFSNLFSTAAALAMAKDKNVNDKIIAQMYTTNAKEMAQNSINMKDYINSLYWENRKQEKALDRKLKETNERMKGVHEVNKNNAYRERTFYWSNKR